MPALPSAFRRARRHLFGPLPTLDALWQGGGRRGVTAALCAVLPLVIGTAQDQTGLGAAGALTAFTSIYGHALPYRRRAVVIAGVGAALVLAGWLGALTGPRSAVLALLCGLLAAAGTVADAVWRVGPPGAVGLVIVCGGSSALGTAPSEHLLAAVAGAALSWVGCMLPWLWDRTGPERRAVEAAERVVAAWRAEPGGARPATVASAVRTADVAVADSGRGAHDDLRLRLRAVEQDFLRGLPTEADLLPGPPAPAAPPPAPRWWHRPWLTTAARTGIGVWAAGVAAVAVGLQNTYWAATTAAAVLAMSGPRQTGSRALHRGVGTAVGVLVAGAVIAADPPVGVTIALIGLMQLGVELLVAHRYWLAVSLITPLVLTLVHMALPNRPAGGLVLERLAETGVGIAVALAVGVLLFRRAGSRRLPDAVRTTAAAVVAAARTPSGDQDRPLHDVLVTLHEVALATRAELAPAPSAAGWLHAARGVADLGWALLGARAQGEAGLVGALTRRIEQELAPEP